MARIISNKLLFIHVPKTGGTYVRELINNIGIPNYETGRFEEHDHKGINDLQKYDHLKSFGIIRKPFDWTISRWKWGMFTEFSAKVKGGTSAKHHWMADVWSDDINEFLFNTINKRKGIAEETMYNMLQIGMPNQVDYILKLENLKDDLSNLFKLHLNIDIDLYTNDISNKKNIELDTKLIFPFLKDEIEKQNNNLMKLYETH
jgi:hypothetical protein